MKKFDNKNASAVSQTLNLIMDRAAAELAAKDLRIIELEEKLEFKSKQLEVAEKIIRDLAESLNAAMLYKKELL